MPECSWATKSSADKQKWENYRKKHVDEPPATAELKAKEILGMSIEEPAPEKIDNNSDPC